MMEWFIPYNPRCKTFLGRYCICWPFSSLHYYVGLDCTASHRKGDKSDSYAGWRVFERVQEWRTGLNSSGKGMKTICSRPQNNHHRAVIHCGCDLRRVMA